MFQGIQNAIERFLLGLIPADLPVAKSALVTTKQQPTVEAPLCPEAKVQDEIISYMPCGDRVDDTSFRLAINPASPLKEEKKQ
jgi:hypothetical protein